MSNLINRYIYDVTRRLPEKEREEVGKELNSNIYDMLSDPENEGEIKEVLYQLGSPAALAEQYRQNPRYLISPAMYDGYIRGLKLVLPLVGCLGLAGGMISGTVEALQYDMTKLYPMIVRIISSGIFLGLSAAFQALLWTTIGFVIAERTNSDPQKNRSEKWTIEDLSEIPASNKNKISLSDSIAELVITVLLSIGAILICTGAFPLVFILQKGDSQISSLFSSEFLTGCIPAIIIISLLGILTCSVKIKYRCWTALVCGITVSSSLISTIIMIYLLNRPNLFSTEFSSFIQDYESLNFIGTNGLSFIPIFTSAIIVIITLSECFHAIYRTIKYRM